MFITIFAPEILKELVHVKTEFNADCNEKKDNKQCLSDTPGSQ